MTQKSYILYYAFYKQLKFQSSRRGFCWKVCVAKQRGDVSRVSRERTSTSEDCSTKREISERRKCLYLPGV